MANFSTQACFVVVLFFAAGTTRWPLFQVAHALHFTFTFMIRVEFVIILSHLWTFDVFRVNLK